MGWLNEYAIVRWALAIGDYMIDQGTEISAIGLVIGFAFVWWRNRPQ